MRRSVSHHALRTLIRALVFSKVDYCNSVLAGLPVTLLQRLQSVMNVAVRLMFSARRSEHIAPPNHSSINYTGCKFGENSVSLVCSVPQRHCTTVPCCDTSEVYQCRSSSPSPSLVYFNIDADRGVNVPFNTRRSRLPGGGCKCLECSACIS